MADKLRTAPDFSFQPDSAGKAQMPHKPTPEQLGRGETKAMRVFQKLMVEYQRLLFLIHDLRAEA